MRPFEEEVAALDTITGVGERSAQTIIAEIGTDMSVFPSAGHLASWPECAPGTMKAPEIRMARPGKGTILCDVLWLNVQKQLGEVRILIYQPNIKGLLPVEVVIGQR